MYFLIYSRLFPFKLNCLNNLFQIQFNFIKFSNLEETKLNKNKFKKKGLESKL